MQPTSDKKQVHRFTKKQSNRKYKLGTQVYLEEVISEPHHSTLSRFILKKKYSSLFPLSLSLSSVKCINQHCMKYLSNIFCTHIQKIYIKWLSNALGFGDMHGSGLCVCVRTSYHFVCLRRADPQPIGGNHLQGQGISVRHQAIKAELIRVKSWASGQHRMTTHNLPTHLTVKA